MSQVERLKGRFTLKHFLMDLWRTLEMQVVWILFVFICILRSSLNSLLKLEKKTREFAAG